MGFSFDGVTSKSMGIASRMATEKRVPELKNRTISMAGRDGLIDLGASLSERVIEISCFIPPKRTAAELLECKDEIVSWLSPDKGVCALMLDTEPGRVYYARLQEGVTFERVVRLAATFDLAFFCPDPFGYAAEDEVFTITEAGNHTVRRRLGNLYSNPVYRLKGVLASGAGRYISITTNGAELKIANATLSEGGNAGNRYGENDGMGGGCGGQHAPQRSAVYRRTEFSHAGSGAEHGGGGGIERHIYGT